ncbi:MAG: hypothetical protein ONA90_11360 [candidate division KSB1 bacterium]|nr:hypothetical protein [candidate division KSB1 bacterium]
MARPLHWGLLTILSGPLAAQPPADNLHQLLHLFDRVAYRLAEQLPDDRIAAIFVKPPPADGRLEERFFFNRLVSVLSDSFSLPIVAEPVDSATTLAIAFNIQLCEILYRPAPKRGFLRRPLWQRHARVFVELSAYDLTTRKVRVQKILEESSMDIVSQKSLPVLEDSNLPFTVGRWKQENGASLHWMEAALITAASGVIVYLFYSLRSR